MDYEKEYKLLIARLKALADVQPAVTKAAIESQFPEIVESEDEKMMNQLHSWMKEFGGAEEYTEKVYNWLQKLIERQGEQRDILEDATLDNNEDGLITDTIKARSERKPTLDIEIPFGMDSELVEETMTIPKGCYAVIKDNKVVIRKGEMPAEWSEEDESHIRYLIECLEHCKRGVALTMTTSTAQEYINWLKSLRPQNRWKPSDEQIYELSKAVDYYTSHGFPNKIINELLEQIKNL